MRKKIDEAKIYTEFMNVLMQNPGTQCHSSPGDPALSCKIHGL